MITTAVEISGEVRVLRRQLSATHKVVKMNVDGLTQQDSLIQPQPGGNCLNWNLGHLLCVYDRLLPILGQKPVLGVETLRRYDRGSAQLQNPAEALDLAVLMRAWDEAAQRVEAGLESLTPEVLDQRAPWSPTNDPEETARSLVSAVFFHQAYHAGQTGLLRRMAGKAGALR